MRLAKIISIILLLCMTFSTLVSSNTEILNETAINATLTANKEIVTEGETIDISFYVDFDEEIEGGLIDLLPSENYEQAMILADGFEFDQNTGTFVTNTPRILNNEALVTFKVKIKDNLLSEEKQKIDFTLSTAPNLYIISNGVEIPISSQSEPLTISIVPTITISGKIDTFSTIDPEYYGITAQLTNTADQSATLIALGATENGKIIIPDTKVGASAYKLEIFGDGFVTSTTEFNAAEDYIAAINDFYPGDVDKNGKIDFYDFHELCIYVNDGQKETAGDLNRDGMVDSKDINCLIEGYKAMNTATSKLSELASTSLYLDTSKISTILPVGSYFELPVKTPESIKSQGIYSYKLVINYNETYIKPIKIEATDGIEGFKKLDKGIIEFWYCANDRTTEDILATIKFEVIKEGSANVKINEESLLLEKDKKEVNVTLDSDDYKSDVNIRVGKTTVAKPIFSTEKRTFVSSLIVRFKERNDGAKIYFTTSNSKKDPNENDELYDENEGIRITKSLTIRAVAIKDGISSEVSTKSYERAYPEGGGGGGNGTIVITNPQNSANPAPTPSAQTKTYYDISNHWSKIYFENLIDKGIINGYEDGTVRPDNQITRAEAAKIIIAAIGLAPSSTTNLTFNDTESIGDWAKGYIQIAVEKGIITGYEDNTFKPSQYVSRKELVVLAMRAFALIDSSDEELVFTDKNSIPDWAKQSVSTALHLGILTGYEDNTFKPDNFVTRGESSKIISSCMGLK